MANMSYCRFRNTASDLGDCLDYMEEELDDEEHNARAAMIRYMARALESIGGFVDISEVDEELRQRK